MHGMGIRDNAVIPTIDYFYSWVTVKFSTLFNCLSIICIIWK